MRPVRPWPDPWLPQRLRGFTAIVQAEQKVEHAARKAIADWLNDVRRLVLDETLTAASPPNMNGFAAADPAWHAALRAFLIPVLGDLFSEAWLRVARVATISPQPHREAYIAQVVSRLKLFPAALMEDIRPELQEAISEGETIDQIRDRIAHALDFDTTRGARGEQSAARGVQGRIDDIERLLDAHDRDPDSSELTGRQVRALRAERGRLYRELRRLNQKWQWKARRIARTETLGAFNAGSYEAAVSDAEALGERRWKVWLSTDDPRTRPSHVLADGQVQPLLAPFDVGGAHLAHPGDPTGPGHEVINCRCTALFLDEEEMADRGLDPLNLPAPQTAPDPAARTAAGTDPFRGERMSVDQLPTGWRGILAPLDVASGDNRIIAAPDELRVREAPRSLLWQRSLDAGHSGAVVAGRIDRVWQQDGQLMGEGPFDLNGEEGAEASRQLAEGWCNGVSVDLDDVTMVEQWYDADGDPIPDEELAQADYDELWEGGARPMFVATSWRLMTATMVAQPAFTEARLEPVYDYASPDEDEGQEDQDAGEDGDQDRAEEGGKGAAAVAGSQSWSMVIAAGSPAYPAAHFAPPDDGLAEPTPLTVTDDGRVYGHLATWNACHTSWSDMCVQPPTSNTGYALFHVGEVLTDEGPLGIGKITVGTGHADAKAAARPAAEHYDHTGTAVAVVRAGEDEHGIWVAGRILDGVSDAQLATLRRSPLSGDWRRVNGHLELVAALCVNVPGFPVPRAVAASGAAGQQISLVAAGSVPQPRPRKAGRDHHGQPHKGLDYQHLARLIVQEQNAFHTRRVRAERLARRIGRDSQSRARDLASVVHPGGAEEDT